MSARGNRLIRPLHARDPQESHRTASVLELFTDLCLVVAIAQAAASLHHQISHDHAVDGAVHFAMAFFAIFWAWLNFAWFASAYDNDDVAYRLLALLQITGSLVLAAGIPRMFDDDFTLGVTGYIIMRIALVALWSRAARNDPPRRATALRYAGGIVLVQCCWVVFLFLPEEAALPAFLLFMVAEMAVPAIAERAGGTPWHADHVAERYGLFFIIVLGETILSATIAIQSALDAGSSTDELIKVVGGGVLIVFSLWWLYFCRDDAEVLRGRGDTANMVWGFGHYFIFASTAAIGGALAARVDHHSHHGPDLPSALALTVPIAIMLVTLYALRLSRHDRSLRTGLPFAVAAVLVLAATWTDAPEPIAGVVLVVLLAVEVINPRGAIGREYAEG